MVNPLFLPELREMLDQDNEDDLREFCEALHPARTADFMDGLSPEESWRVLLYTELSRRVEIFGYFDGSNQVALIESLDRDAMAELVSELAPDDRVDLLGQVDPKIVDELLPLLPADDRRDYLHLRQYAEGTAGAVMTTDVAKLGEELTVRETIQYLQEEIEEIETIYYLYVVNEQDHLRGLVTARQLLAAIRKPETKLSDLMETGLVTVEVDDDQEEVARKVARYDLVAIPVVDMERKMLGIITYDDVIDVVREEATEDAHRSAAVEPLQDTYLETGILTMVWKRGIWLTVLFFAALLTAYALRHYHGYTEKWEWLVVFIPLIISSGGNMGNQSATLVITGMTTRDLKLSDWPRVLNREIATGFIIGAFLSGCGLMAAYMLAPESRAGHAMWVLPITLFSVVVVGAISGAILPIAFRRIGLDPSLMSHPFVAGIIDVLGIVIYMNVAWLLL